MIVLGVAASLLGVPSPSHAGVWGCTATGQPLQYNSTTDTIGCSILPNAGLSNSSITVGIGTNFGMSASLCAPVSLGGTCTLGSTADTLQFTGLGLGTAAPANGIKIGNGNLSFSVSGNGIVGTTTNDNAAAGIVGEYAEASTAVTGQAQSSATVTITIASPAVVTWGTTIPFSAVGNNAQVLNFTTTGALPTGITAGTNYYACGNTISGNTFKIATSVDNCIAGTYVNTSGSQSGTQTGVPTGILASGTPLNIGGFSIIAGDYDVSGAMAFFSGGTTSITLLVSSLSLTSATLDGRPMRENQFGPPAEVPGVANNIFGVGPSRFPLSATTTIYCVAQGTFTVSTLSAWGGCRARRIR